MPKADSKPEERVPFGIDYLPDGRKYTYYHPPEEFDLLCQGPTHVDAFDRRWDRYMDQELLLRSIAAKQALRQKQREHFRGQLAQLQADYDIWLARRHP